MYLHGLSSIHLQKNWIINIAQLLVGLFFLLHTSPLIAHKLLRKLYKGKTGVRRLDLIERNPPTVGQRAC